MSSPIVGLGICPLGVAPLGFGSPATSDQIAQGNTPYRFIDPSTGDWQSTSTPGILDGMEKNSQRVLLALMTQQGSSTSLPDYGNTVHQLGKVDETFESQLKDRVSTALNQLTNIENVISITDITVNEVSPGNVTYSVFFFDKEREQSDFITLQRLT